MRALRKGEVIAVGIDVALAHMGFAKAIVSAKEAKIVEVVELLLVTTKPENKKTVRRSSDRVRRGKELLQEMRRFCCGGTMAIAEVPEGSQDAQAAWALGVATGILCSCPLPLIEVSPREVKLATVRKETASKDEMRRWGYSAFPEAPWKTHGGRRTKDNEHLADALASIQAGLLTEQFRGFAGCWTVAEIMASPMEDEPEAPRVRRRLKL